MSDITAKTLSKSIWITGCIFDKEGLEISHLYGDQASEWKDVAFATAVELRRKGEEEAPVIVLILKESDDIYFINIKKVNPRHFIFRELASREGADSLADMWEAAKKGEHEKVLRRISESIGSRLTTTSIDKPLADVINRGAISLPVHTSVASITDYCRTIIASLSDRDQEALEIPDLSYEDLRTVSAPSARKEEWDEGTVIEGRFVILKSHKGGMGIVYEAFDSETLKYYAVKTFQERFLWDERIVDLFVNEAEIWVKLERNLNIVTAELVKIIEGRPYIFLEYIQGTDLEKIIKKGKLPVKNAIEYATQFCCGMDYASKKLGLIHRDIKPSNCLITREGVLKITDFGLGKVFDQITEGGDEKNPAPSSMPDTIISIEHAFSSNSLPESMNARSKASTSMAGTLSFMAPELFSDMQAAGVKSDIYSFGLMFYMMLTGKNPMDSDDEMEVVDHHLTLSPEDPRALNEAVPKELGELVIRCIEKDPANRPEHFEEIRTALEDLYEKTFQTRYVLPEVAEEFNEADWLNKGISLASLGRNEDARKAFDQALRISPGSVDARIHKGKSLIALGNHVQAIPLLDEAIAIGQNSWQARFNKGEALWRLEKRDEALACFEAALSLSENNYEILGRMGRLLTEQGRYEEARRCFRSALGRNPKSEALWFDRGSLLMAMKLFESASESFLKAIDINPRMAGAWKARGEALLRLGHHGDAVTAFQKFLAIEKSDPGVQILIGNCFREMGNHQRALLSYNAAIEKDPKSPRGYLEKSLLLSQQEQWERALQCIVKAEENGIIDDELVIKKAALFIELGYYKDCQELLRNSSLMEKDIPVAREVYALASGWLNEGDRFIEKILSFRGFDPEAIFDTLETALLVFCEPAIAALQLHSFMIERKDLKRWILLAQLRLVAGDFKGALEAAESALLIDDSSELASDLIRKAHELLPLLGPGSEDEPASPDSEVHDSEEKKSSSIWFSPLHKVAEQLKQDLVERVSLDTPKGRGARPAVNIEYMKWLALALYDASRGKYSRAIKHLDKVAQLNPGFHARRYFLARYYEAIGDEVEAQSFYDRFISVFEQSCGYYRNKALSGESRSLPYEEIESYFHKWIGYYPHDVNGWIAYMRFLLKKGLVVESRAIALYIMGCFSEKEMKLQLPCRACLILGILNLYLGRMTAAMRFFSEAIEDGEDEVIARLGEARCLELQRQMGKAVEIYQKYRESERASVISLFMLATIALEENDVPGSLQYLNEALAKRELSALLSFKKAEIAVKRGKYVEFFQIYTESDYYVAKFFPMRQLRSMALAQTMKFDNALEDIREAWNQEPENIVISKWLTLFYLKKNLLEEALETITRTRQLYPFDGECQLIEGMTHFFREAYEQAMDAFRGAHSKLPHRFEILYYMAVTFYHQKEMEAAEVNFLQAQRMNPRYIPNWINLGVFYLKQEKFEQSVQYFEGALRIDSENSGAWLLRSYCQMSLDDLEEALKSVERALYIAPHDRYMTILKGIIDFKRKSFSSAIDSFKKVLIMSDKEASDWYNLAIAQLFNGEAEIAQLSFNMAGEINPDLFEVHMGKAFCYHILRRKSTTTEHLREESQKCLIEARRLDPERFRASVRQDEKGEQTLTLHPLDMIPIPFELSFESLFKVFDPFTIFHLLDLDEAF
jgi:tetratricopeptide (TPR) repeat protein/tRNA A-37 threonylcarbamoyl transferase component Bud32